VLSPDASSDRPERDQRSTLQTQSEVMDGSDARHAKRKRESNLEDVENPNQRARLTYSPTPPVFAISRQWSRGTYDRLSLPSMPGGQSDDLAGNVVDLGLEIKNQIYSHLLPSSPHEVEAERRRKTNRACGEVSLGFAGLTQVCQMCRYEYVSYVLSRTTFVMN
jgi:hypothetical protein